MELTGDFESLSHRSETTGKLVSKDMGKERGESSEGWQKKPGSETLISTPRAR